MARLHSRKGPGQAFAHAMARVGRTHLSNRITAYSGAYITEIVSFSTGKTGTGNARILFWKVPRVGFEPTLHAV